jgi:predicted GIY-YIG superfamily endonuclease
MYYIYLLKLSNNEIYTGSTKDLKQRIADHQEGKIFHQTISASKTYLLLLFSHQTQSVKFEMYLKSGSGKAFRNKHLVEKEKAQV